MQSVEDDSLSQRSRLQILFNKLCLLMLQDPKGLLNIIWNQRSLYPSLFNSNDCIIHTYVHAKTRHKASRICAGSTRKRHSNTADVLAGFHKNLCRKIAENFEAT